MLLIAGAFSYASLPLTPAQKVELSAIRGDLTRVHTPIRHDLIDQSEKKVNEAEQRLDTFVKDAGIGDSDSHITSIRKLIATRRTAIEKARAKEAQKKESGEAESRPKKGTAKEKGGGFVLQVAPIFRQALSRAAMGRMRRAVCGSTLMPEWRRGQERTAVADR